MKPKRLSSLPNLPHRKSSFLFGPEVQILGQTETICSQQDNLERYQNVLVSFPNDIGTFITNGRTRVAQIVTTNSTIRETQSQKDLKFLKFLAGIKHTVLCGYVAKRAKFDVSVKF
jgi:hypothetical protein